MLKNYDIGFESICFSKKYSGQVSMKRINRYMNAEELDPTSVSHDVNHKDVVSVTLTFYYDA